MEDIENYKGYLLAAHPKRPEQVLRRGVIMVIDHDQTGALGLQINKPLESSTTLGTVMETLGMSLKKDCPLYFGGTENANRIIVVHSLDWTSSGTTKINDEIGYSNDITVLAALSEGKGPEYFRAVAGYTRWLPGHLESEIEGLGPWYDVTASWNVIPADSDLVFNFAGIEQWHYVIEESAKIQISSWF